MGVATRGVGRQARTRALTTGEIAWIAAIPAAALGLLAIALLGPPLGHALLPPQTAFFWLYWTFAVMPEPAEQGRYLVALAVPLLLSAITVAGVRTKLTIAGGSALASAAQGLVAALVIASIAGQHGAFGSIVPNRQFAPPVAQLLPWKTLVVAAVATAAAAIALRRARGRAALTRWMRETRARRIGIAVVVLLAIAIWLLHAFETEGTIAVAQAEVRYNAWFTFDETFAVLDGRSPLVNFAAQYGSLWPYAFAGVMSIVGRSFGIWVALALATTGAGMFAIYAVLRRAARSAVAGSLLFLPLLATSFILLEGTRQSRWTFANYFGTFPMRYAGPCILAWLVARHIDRARPRRMWPLFVVAGLVALNNVDAGVPALGATLAALLWVAPPTRRRLARIAVEATAGLLLAFALVSLLTLTRTGQLPHLALLVRYARLFSRTGFAMYPMPLLGLHVAIFLTYVAAIGAATVGALRPGADRLLTGMLAWSGVFGLGAGAYYVGRSTPDDLPAMFLPWGLALALLLIPALGAIRDAAWRRPPIAAVLCLFGFFAMACSLAQTPTPWEQIERLERTGDPIFAAPSGQQLVARSVQRGEPVAILNLLGHRIAANVGVPNVSPYSNAESIMTFEQLYETVDDLRAAGGRKLFLDLATVRDGLPQALAQVGFSMTTNEGTTQLWVDGG